MQYNDDIIEEVLRRTDIVELIGQDVKLKRSGANYQGLWKRLLPSMSLPPNSSITASAATPEEMRSPT